MSPIRMAKPEDFESVVRCASCDEPLPQADAAEFVGEHFHPACRRDLVRCCWCGKWLLATEAKQLGNEFYHQVCFQEAR